ncbi:MAG: RDD family protein [Candidatus Electryonea clarkiae]|nr:RDD family protein [Candidatus Electryonea clarkiae]MDP8285298.1 RDD family protein [Candidatus Electryonea clarkiae]
MPVFGSIWKRFFAGLVDFIFFGAVFVALSLFFLSLLPSEKASCVIIDILLAGFFCYDIHVSFLYLLSSTPGKLLFGLRIVDVTKGEKPVIPQLLLRGLFFPVSFLPLGLGFWWIFFDSRRQTAHDKISGTVVITKPEKSETTEKESWTNATESDSKRFVFMKIVMILSIIILLVVVPIVLYFLGSDEQLSDQAQEWFADKAGAEIPADENAFYWIVGFSAPSDMDPVMAAVEWAENENKRIESFSYDNIPDEVKFKKIPVDSIFKELKAAVPFISDYNSSKPVFDSITKIDELYQRCRFLTDRYDKLLLLKNFNSPITPHQIADHSISPLLLRYQNFENAWLLIQYKKGDHQFVIDRLQSSIEMSRNLLKEADNMLIKLLCSVLLQKELRLVNILLDVEDRPSTELNRMIMNLSPLISEEISLRKAIHYESLIVKNSTEDLLENIERNRSAKKSLGYLVTKPNATLNIVVESYSNVAALSEKTAGEYMNSYEDFYPVDVGVLDFIRNFYWVIMSGNAEAYVNYAEMGFYTDAQINLLKAKADIKSNGKTSVEIPAFLEEQKSIYYNVFTGEALGWDKETKELFFTGPHQDHYENERKIKLEIL